MIIFILARAVKARHTRSKVNAHQYVESRPSAEIAQWFHRRVVELDAQAQRFSQGNVSVTFIVSDDSTGHSWQHMSSGAISAERCKLLCEAHTWKLAPSAVPHPPLVEAEMKCASADMWPRREQESLISFFSEQDDMQEFFAKVRVCVDIDVSVTVGLIPSYL